MNWITEGIGLGGWYGAVDTPGLRKEGITAVLQIHDPEAAPDSFPFAEAALTLRAADGRPLADETLRRGVAFIREQQAAGRKMLVACSAGRSRSATFLAAYLHEEGMDLLEAFLMLIRRRRCVLPHPELVRSLIRHYGLPTTVGAFMAELVRRRREALEWTGSSKDSPSEG